MNPLHDTPPDDTPARDGPPDAFPIVTLHPAVAAHHADDEPIDALALGPDEGPRAVQAQVDRNFARFGRQEPPVAREEQLDVAVLAARSVLASADVDHIVRVGYFHPEPGTVLPVHVYLHGGGWVIGSIDELPTVTAARFRARTARCAVLTVDYRLAMRDPFPAALDDVLATIDFVVTDGSALDLDPSSISIGGQSAGGNLAVAAALATDHPLVGVLAEIPALDLTGSTMIAAEPAIAPMIEEVASGIVEVYCGAAVTAEQPLVSPLRAADLHRLPETWLFASGLDPLRHDAIAMAARLTAAGVDNHLSVYAGALHDSLLLTAVWDTAARWEAAVGAALRAAHWPAAAGSSGSPGSAR